VPGEPGELRVSDQDREQVASEIREHFAQGRLSSDELDERLALAYSARTQADLDALRRDLPKLPMTRAQSRAEVAERRAELSRHLVQQTGYALVPFAVCTLIWLASGMSGGFWPVWVLVVAAIPLMRNLWRLYGPAPDLDAAERHLRHGRRHGHRLPPGPPPPPQP
jgi:uncharacterized membrane protein YccC